MGSEEVGNGSKEKEKSASGLLKLLEELWCRTLGCAVLEVED